MQLENSTRETWLSQYENPPSKGRTRIEAKMVHEVLIWPDSRLREKAEEVKKFDDSLGSLIDDLFETLHSAKGIGLAATQIGVNKRVFVIDTSSKQDGSSPQVFVNPVFLHQEGKVLFDEACLSVPGESGEVQRFEKVVVQAFDQQGKQFQMEASDLLAIALQHETDHLNGVLYVDHLSPLKREMIKKRMKRLKASQEEEAKKKTESTVSER
jgi:peptide deformylase